jgi:hypothetical protein
MDSTVEAKFRIRLGKTEVEVSKEEAEALYSALFAALNKSLINWNPISYPVVIREYPQYTPPIKWLPYEVTCDTSNMTFYSSDTINVRSVN